MQAGIGDICATDDDAIAAGAVQSDATLIGCVDGGGGTRGSGTRISLGTHTKTGDCYKCRMTLASK